MLKKIKERSLDIIYSLSLIFTHGKSGAAKGLIHQKSLAKELIQEPKFEI